MKIFSHKFSADPINQGYDFGTKCFVTAAKKERES